ncbi:MAG: response regulator transcription factor [Anaerolineae bacterium]|nr:response regulator transcription factor [Anaerolineae bacterium]
MIVDDHAMLRKGLAVFLLSYPDLKPVGEASNGKEALAVCANQLPDIVLMDLMMPIMDGIIATRLIRQDFPDTQVIALTSFGEERLIKDILVAGAISYLFKKISADDLAQAIRSAQNGIATYAPEVTKILLESLQKPKSRFEALTTREREVLALIVKGMGNNQIADALVISPSTAKSHVSNILAKLGVASRSEVIAMVMEDSFNLGDFYIK